MLIHVWCCCAKKEVLIYTVYTQSLLYIYEHSQHTIHIHKHLNGVSLMNHITNILHYNVFFYLYVFSFYYWITKSPMSLQMPPLLLDMMRPFSVCHPTRAQHCHIFSRDQCLQPELPEWAPGGRRKHCFITLSFLRGGFASEQRALRQKKKKKKVLQSKEERPL